MIAIVLHNLIFQKTERGRVELSTRLLGLSNALRLVLVLIDGRRDVRTLQALSEHVRSAPNCLEDLLNEGLIEVIGESSESDSSVADLITEVAKAPRMTNLPNASAMPVMAKPTIAPAYSTAAQIPETAMSYPAQVAESTSRPIATNFGVPASNPAGRSEQLNRAKAMLMNYLKKHMRDEASVACERVAQCQNSEEMLVLLGKLSDLVGLYSSKSVGERVYAEVRDALV